MTISLLADLEHPRQVFANITPNWFASVMGTGIVAVAAASLPEQFPGLRVAATAMWLLAVALLGLVTAATVTHWVRHRERAASHISDPVMAHFYGAIPMAILTVGAGTLLLGRDILGLTVAVDIDWVLWFAGTILGLTGAVSIPYLMFARPDVRPGRTSSASSASAAFGAFGGWLMPVVPPMVSASTGALLVPYAPAGPARLGLLLSCYAMFGLSLLASVIVIRLIWQRVAAHEVGPARLVPTLWIVLGPLGQSITAVNLLGGVAHLAVPAPWAAALRAFGVVYGIPVWGFALLWAGIAGAVTLRTARAGLPFSLTWWSFTFPVGTCVTGTTGLALHTGSELFRIAAVMIFCALVGAWAVVAARTLHGVLSGRLLALNPPLLAP